MELNFLGDFFSGMSPFSNFPTQHWHNYERCYCNLFGTQCITWSIYFNYIICAFNQARMNEKKIIGLSHFHPNYLGGGALLQSPASV